MVDGSSRAPAPQRLAQSLRAHVSSKGRLRDWSQHPGGANWLFADGAVRFLSYANASLMVLATRAGGEVVSGLQ